MITPSFEIREHTADFIIAGRGPDLDGLFAAMAQGLFRLLADGDSPRAVVRRRLAVEAGSTAELLHGWLSELNALHQIHGELYGEFTVNVSDGSLTAIVAGEPIAARHGMQHEVKGVTWHELEVEQDGDAWVAQVLVDV